MGISSKAAQWLLELAVQTPLSGSILTLGVQDQSYNYAKLREIAQAACFSSDTLASVLSINDPAAVVDDVSFLRVLGFSEVVRTDYDAFEGAEFTFDLGASEAPPLAQRGRFDCVLDGGTLEHVFNTPNALRHIYEFLKPTGRVVHMSPTNNYVDHGFYSFSPAFFYEFYEENNFYIEKCSLLRHTRDVEGSPWVVGDYRPGSLNYTLFGGLDDGLYLTFVSAAKTERSTCDRFPQQGMYKEAWQDGNQDAHLRDLAKRQREKDSKHRRPEWIQARFTKFADLIDRLSRWLRRPSERREFPLENTRVY